MGLLLANPVQVLEQVVFSIRRSVEVIIAVRRNRSTQLRSPVRISNGEKRDSVALTVESHSGLIYAERNHRCVLVKRFRILKFCPANPLPVHRRNEYSEQCRGLNGVLLPRDLETQRVHARGEPTERDAKTLLLEHFVVPLFVFWFQLPVQGHYNTDIAGVYMRRNDGGLGGVSFLLRAPSHVNARGEVVRVAYVSLVPA